MVEYICDGCGKREPASKAGNGEPIKPYLWYSRLDDDGEQHACSRECIERIAASTGKTSVVIPL